MHWRPYVPAHVMETVADSIAQTLQSEALDGCLMDNVSHYHVIDGEVDYCIIESGDAQGSAAGLVDLERARHRRLHLHHSLCSCISKQDKLLIAACRYVVAGNKSDK